MRYSEFNRTVAEQFSGLDLTNRSVQYFLRQAYESRPKGVDEEQQQAYARGVALGAKAGSRNTLDILTATIISRK